MLFNSYIFVFLFFPICLAGYYGLIHWKKKEMAQLFLVAMSFWFYGYFQVNYLLIMITSILVNYAFHRILSKELPRNAAKGIMIAAVAANLGILFYFKYFDFFLTNINQVFGTEFLLRKIVLPLGISFFTFQQIGFVVDTYRGEVQNCKLLEYALFVSFFPQLIAGPIVNQSEMLPQFAAMTERKFDWEKFARGFILFVLGMFKKVILADTLGAGVDFGYGNPDVLGRLDALVVMFAYTLQLYFDFSGYCDMARGIGKMLGMEIPVNFNSPYKAVNIIDFWKRWHITLNRFFTKYVYIPLGGNRKGTARMYRNLLLVFLLSGIWHGAGWNYIVWGMLHGVLYVITRWWQKRTGEAGKKTKNILMTYVSRILLFIYVSVAWVYFRAENIAQANKLLGIVLTGKLQKLSMELAECFQLDEFWYVLKVLHLDAMAYSRYILMFVMLAAGIYLAMFSRNASEIADRVKGKTFSAIMLGAVFVWCILSFSQVSTFLYFNF
ncbi:MAG: MBOAT family protein [Lachnospiraceae bacterium]|nr:MBOAT family protein [Lachnospiraceae bacterium]